MAIHSGLMAATAVPSSTQRARARAGGAGEQERSRRNDSGGRSGRSGSSEPGSRLAGTPKPVRSRGTGPLAWVTDITLTLALIGGLFVFWSLEWSNVQADEQQNDVARSMEDQWAADGGSQPLNSADGNAADLEVLSTGQAFSYLHIPRLEDQWKRAAVEGVDQKSLSTGPGHYPETQLPGERGNTVFAGHRDGQGAPFHDVDKLTTCDSIVVETRDRWITYRVLPVDNKAGAEGYREAISACVKADIVNKLQTVDYAGLSGQEIVYPNETDVISPIPNRPQASEKEAGVGLLTLTSCHPIWSNEQRIIVHAVMTDQTLKSSEMPGWSPPALDQSVT